MALRDESDLLRRIIVDCAHAEIQWAPEGRRREPQEMARRIAEDVIEMARRNGIQIVTPSWPSGDE
jgi:hypothetical protein